MSGNSFGKIFRVTTWGESHGPAVGVVIDGCPPLLEIAACDIQSELDRRAPGKTLGASPRKETDAVEILSGIFEGRTTGTPISLLIRNRDVDSGPYEPWREIFRPGHADFTYQAKYGIRDHRGGGRSSARETAARVAAGAVAKKILRRENIEVLAYTVELGGIRASVMEREEIARNPFACPDPKAAGEMGTKMEEVRAGGDTLGGVVEISVRGCPPGLGAPVFDKLEADLAKALMSIGAVRGVEIGAGFGIARMTGSRSNDPLVPGGFAKNDAGGIVGGISTGAEIILRAAVKPIPSISMEQKTVDRSGRPTTIRMEGRHDACAIPRINPVCEAMVALVLVDHLLRQQAVRLPAPAAVKRESERGKKMEIHPTGDPEK